MLAQADATLFAADLAQALADRDVPAVVEARRGTDWRLAVGADLHNDAAGPQVIPTYTVLNPRGVPQGTTAGPMVSAATWSRAAPAALNLVAARDAPAIATLLDSIKAAVQQSDPNSLVNRPPRVLLAGVTGAPGDGNQALRAQMSAQLSNLGLVVQNTAQGSDYQVAGAVKIAPALPGQSRIEIQWTVLDPYGREAGHLLQMNDIAQGSLDRYWGDVAQVVAQEAAGGVRDVIVNQTEVHRIGVKARPGALPLDPAGGSTPRPALPGVDATAVASTPGSAGLGVLPPAGSRGSAPGLALTPMQ